MISMKVKFRIIRTLPRLAVAKRFTTKRKGNATLNNKITLIQSITRVATLAALV
jgi:hypothetical protein